MPVALLAARRGFNAAVIVKYGQQPGRSEPEIFAEYCREKLKLDPAQTAKFRDQFFKDKYLITKLKPQEKFECDFVLSMGTATEHARWQAVNTISYRYLIPGVDDAAPAPLLQYDTVSLSQEKGAAAGNKVPQGFMFYIEKGTLPISTVCQTALQIISEKITVFSDFVQQQVVKGWNKEGLFEFEYPNETHTVGNLIATYGILSFPDAFIGYRIIHPLENKILLRFKFSQGEPADYVENIKQICDKIKQDCTALLTFV